MTTQELDARMRGLEARCRRQNRIMLFLGSTLALSFAAACFGGGDEAEASEAGAEGPIVELVGARGFQLVKPDGSVLWEAKFNGSDQTTLRINDIEGNERWSTMVSTAGTSSVIWDSNGNLRTLAAHVEEGDIANVTLGDGNGQQRVALTVAGEETSLIQTNASGMDQIRSFVNDDVSGIKQFDQSGTSRLQFAIGPQGPGMSVYDCRGVIRAHVGSIHDGTGILAESTILLADPQGMPVYKLP